MSIRPSVCPAVCHSVCPSVYFAVERNVELEVVHTGIPDLKLKFAIDGSIYRT